MKSFGRLILNPLSTRQHAMGGVLAIAFWLAILVTLPIAGIADALYGTLIGTVTDKTGAVVPGVTVTCDESGHGSSSHYGYRFSGRLPGEQPSSGHVHRIAAGRRLCGIYAEERHDRDQPAGAH